MSPSTVSVSAGVNAAAPTAQVGMTFSAPYSGDLYLLSNQGFQGIDSLNAGAASGLTQYVVITFKTPSSLGQGTYVDDLMLGASTDSQGKNLLPNSPQHVQVTYTVTGAAGAGITSLSPSSATAGGAGFTLTVNGNNFTYASTIQWNGAALDTTCVSSSQVTAAVPATDLAIAGTYPVTVSDPTYGLSNAMNFTVQVPPFSIGLLVPASAVAGGPAFTLSVNGSQFAQGASVLWNGTALTTTFVSATQLTAQVPAPDIAATGTASVTVQNPGVQGTSNVLTFIIGGYDPDAVAFQVDPGHSGCTAFKSVTLPAAPLWTAKLDGAPSYPLIAQGLVFVTCPISGGAELVALSQATGAVAWGPIMIGGQCNAAYDSGKVFVASEVGGYSGAIMQAFDAASGKLLWSAILPGQYFLDAMPSALNGKVYVTEAESGVSLYAFDESNGALLWTRVTDAGDDGGPAVTASGVYIAGPQEAYAFDPLTGTQQWSNLLGGDGGGGAVPVVADGLAFMPDGFGTYNGQVLDAVTGTVDGSYVASCPPAISPVSGFFLQSGTLRRIDLATNTIRWSFPGDGNLNTSPIVVNGYVFIGSSMGTLFGLDQATGNQVWSQNLGAAIPGGATWGHTMPFTGLEAGDGLLVVPAGNSLSAFQLDSN